MKRSMLVTMVALGSALTVACRAPSGWTSEDVLRAESVEIQLDEDARPVEVEYHVPPDRVPANVLAAMDELHPGGRAVAAEKELVGTTVYWEVTKEIDGRDVEAMFRENGDLHSEELEIRAADVPDNVQKAVQARLEGVIDKWEEIRDAERSLVAYHAKTSVGGNKYKVMVSPGGEVLGVFREVPAEIEVPLPEDHGPGTP